MNPPVRGGRWTEDQDACSRIADLIEAGSPQRTAGTPLSRNRNFLFPLLLVGGFAVTPAPGPASITHERSNAMMQVRAMAVAAAVSVTTLVSPESARADAVQWTGPGSNGHWYEGVALATNTTWAQARVRAAERGGHLATLTTQAELTWVTQNFGGPNDLWHQTWGPFIGGIQDLPGAVEPLGGWRWITDEPWLDAWGTNNCGADNYNDGDALSLGRCSSDSDISYNDSGINATGNAGGVGHAAMIVEWSADCDGNGVVDFGEIRAGTLPDDNQNGVPDGCECAANPSLPTCCPGDVVATGFVDGVDLAALFSAWGTNGGEFPRADVDRSGVVDAADLYFVLANWGSCQG